MKDTFQVIMVFIIHVLQARALFDYLELRVKTICFLNYGTSSVFYVKFKKIIINILT